MEKLKSTGHKINLFCVRFQVLEAVTIKSSATWEKFANPLDENTACIFRGTQQNSFKPTDVSSRLHNVILKKGVAYAFYFLLFLQKIIIAQSSTVTEDYHLLGYNAV
jgi:hypothetical protein